MTFKKVPQIGTNLYFTKKKLTSNIGSWIKNHEATNFTAATYEEEQCCQLWISISLLLENYYWPQKVRVGNTDCQQEDLFLPKHSEFATKASSMDSFEYPWSGSIRPRAIHRPVIDWRSSPMQRAFLAHVHGFFSTFRTKHIHC